VARYGADTVRLFLLFIGPWDQGGPWSPTGIEGVSRFLSRVWSVAQAPVHEPEGTSADLLMATIEDAGRELQRVTHQTIAAVSDDYATLHFNTAIAKLMELTSAIGRARDDGLAGSDGYQRAIDTLLLLLAPAAPHLTEELWERRGRPYSIHRQAWPVADEGLAAADMIEVPVQVDGKLRDRLLVAPDTSEADIERLALASARVQAHLDGKPPARVVHIPGRVVNVVTAR
jgi:leucyl-tRNA synthetase